MLRINLTIINKYIIHIEHAGDIVVKLKKVIKKDMNINKSEKPLLIAGPCSVESHQVMQETAVFLKKLGIEYIRGGAFKPRTSPYSFQGLGEQGLEILSQIKTCYGLKVVSEVLDVREIDMVCQVADIVQVGSRNMYNYSLLKELGRTGKTILLKRGLSATLDEWLGAAEYIALAGNDNIILCERGIRTFEPSTRNTMDLNAIPLIKQRTGLKVIADASHGTGVREIVNPMCMASVACGADGLLTEIHPRPEEAMSDGFQSLNFEEYERLYGDVMGLYRYIRKTKNEESKSML